MSEGHKPPHPIRHEECESQIQKHHEMSPEEMLGELWEQLDSMDDISFDSKKMDAYLERLEQAGCPMPEADAEASWADFREKHQTRLQAGMPPPKTRKTRTKLRRYSVARVATAAAFALVVSMITAQALGFDILGAFGRWTEKTFHFEPTSAARTQQDAQNERYLEAIRTALEDCGMSVDLAPAWLPDGFTMLEPKISESDFGYKIYYSFSDADAREFDLRFKKYNEPEYLDTTTYEKDGAEVELYSNKSQTFYIFSNLDFTTATWADEYNCVSISGTVSQQEAKRIIDSMGGKEE